jgi:hypothetical protein
MNEKTFDKFVNRQQEAATEIMSMNWGKERDEWLSHLERLYSKIESFLKKYKLSGQIRIEYRKVQLNEEGIGSYTAKQMTLWIGLQEVDLVPLGTLFIGSKGRVDVIGPMGKGEILLVDRQRTSGRPQVLVSVGMNGKVPSAPIKPARRVDWEWRIVSRPPERNFIEITQESLFQLIMEVANG